MGKKKLDHSDTPVAESDLFNLAQVGMLIISSEGNVLNINPLARFFLGNNSACSSLHFDELFCFEKTFDLTKWYRNALTGKVTDKEFEVFIGSKCNSLRKGIINLQLFHNDKAEKLILCQIYNIGVRNKNAGKNTHQNPILLELINNIPDNIFIKDTESRFMLANVWVSQVMGAKSPKDLIGKTDLDFHPKKLAQKYRQDELEIITTGEAKLNIIEQVLDKKFNRRWYSTSKIPLKDDTGKIIGIMGIGRDITPWVKKQKELRKAKHAAEKADQLKSSFLANLSHEIRTPLNAILGFSQFLRQMVEPGAKGNQYIDLIVQNGKRLLLLINDIIDISKIDSGQMIINKQKFDLNDLIKQLEITFHELMTSMEKSSIRLKLELALEEEKSIINSDAIRIKQILYNLLSNAVKFTKEGSITVGYTLTDHGIRFFVRDTGIGIPPQHLGLIFERFTQGDNTVTRQYEGAGIGLPIARGLVRLLGGEINVISEVNKGSEFYFTLPVSGHYRRKVKQSHPKIHRNDLRIVVLGAYSSIDKKVLNVIQKGAVLNYSKDISDLYQLLKSAEQQPDLILFYPETTQEEPCSLINEISNIMPQIPILVITNITRNLFIEECLVAGAKDFIAEPVDTELLSEKIELLTHRSAR